ncbi:accessory gland protein Acp29AB-like [Drosophila subpulchrella]|uniref:accessory gland protein Acp29AB-like n=1 Tax=Drosophila subpulchrella TaxID=1486046 RepID=UPI0018A188A4|nr:accessory gland protein Acp29AB-like [Drosophila subpulchrella]
MFKTAAVLLSALLCGFLSLDVVSSECKVEDPVNQCGGFCFRSLWPILDHVAYHQSSGMNLTDFHQQGSQVQLDNIERQLAAQQQVISNLASLQSKAKKGLPKDFELVGTGFYYIEQSKSLNWFAAEDFCRRMGGHLASIRSDAELAALKAKLPSSTDFWIDINDLANRGEYMSLTSGKRPRFMSWSSGQPTRGDSERCVLLEKQMWDRQCEEQNYFICQAGDEIE